MSERATFLGMPMPTEPTPWADVRWHELFQDVSIAHALTAIVSHLNCTLQSRWEPEQGIVWRMVPKADANG